MISVVFINQCNFLKLHVAVSKSFAEYLEDSVSQHLLVEVETYGRDGGEDDDPLNE